jgi:hypothetical protein
MAARIRKHHQDEVRARIQVSQLINVLEKQALGESEDLSPSRMKAIEILLRKSLPDLSAIQIDNGAEEGDSVADVVRAFHEQRRAGGT